MIPSFTLKLIPQLIFGIGKRAVIAEKARQFGENILIITGGKSFQSSSYFNETQESLRAAGISFSIENIPGEPSPETIDAIVVKYAGTAIDVVVAIGGGSALDAGKAISAMLVEEGSVTDYLEGVGSKVPGGIKVPFIAIPTTSGTGSEATSNAVISSVGERGFKKSLRHDNYIPNLAIVDPELTLSCPQNLTLCCGMDCFTQLVEAYLSTKGNPVTDSLALQGIKAIARSLPEVVANGQNLVARTDLSYAAFLSGVVLANAGLGTVHGFASEIGGRFPVPHGLVCGTLMEPANRLTLKRLREKGENPEALGKFTKLGEIFNNRKERSEGYYQDAFIETLASYTSTMGIPDLKDYRITESDIRSIVAGTGNKNNPVQLNTDDLEDILRSRC